MIIRKHSLGKEKLPAGDNKINMAIILMMIFGAEINAGTFLGNKYTFTKSDRGDAEVEQKRHDLEDEKLQKPKDK